MYILMGLLGVWGCGGGQIDVDWDDSGGPSYPSFEADADGDVDADADGDASFSITWGADNVVAAVVNGDLYGYFFGLAETGAGTTGWYGEDCLSADSICHEVIDTTTLACASGVDEVWASNATLHCGVEYDTSWAFWGGADWDTLMAAGGDDASYFGG